MGALQNLEKGQFGAAFNDVANWIEGREEFLVKQFPALETLAEKVASDEEGIIVKEIGVAATTVQAAGYTAESFIAAAKTALTAIVSQGISVAIGDVFVLLNAKTTELQTPVAS